MIKKNFLKVLNYHSLLRSTASLLLLLLLLLFCFVLPFSLLLASLGIHSQTSFSDNPSVNLEVLRKVSYVILVSDSDSDFGIHHWFLNLPFRVTQVIEIKYNQIYVCSASKTLSKSTWWKRGPIGVYRENCLNYRASYFIPKLSWRKSYN